ncbi:hypothetical protein [Halodesulfovibrio sp.]|uniref:LpxL/LpxP family acyltransferase n=1 Tax=Halodesulfovibrio sp. TaxID=1912772 RepID=UPI0025C53CB4|nr:hypothetical protein [Halodesulfovibrio sp.]
MTSMTASKWSSKSLGGQLRHQFFYFLVRIGGIIPPYIVLVFVVGWYSLLPSVRRRSQPYLTRRFTSCGWLSRLWKGFRLNLSFGMVLLDRIIYRELGRGAVLAQEEDNERIRSLLAEGNGLIVLSAHVGCWQTGIAGLACGGVPINVVLLQEQGNVDLHFFQQGSRGPSVNVIDPSGPFGGMIEMLSALKRNEIVCVMGDRYLQGDKNLVDVKYFGEQVKLPMFPISVAAAAGAPVAVMATLREGACVARAHVLDVFSVPANVGKRTELCRPYVQRFATSLERLAWMQPYQIFNFFDMWN